MFRVKDLYSRYQKSLGLEPLLKKRGFFKTIHKPEVKLPGLCLAGYLKNYIPNKILIFDVMELHYMNEMSPKKRRKVFNAIISRKTPIVFLSENGEAPLELITICQKNSVALFRSKLDAISCVNRLLLILHEEFSLVETLHGTLVEVHGVGVLLQGESSVGKSEAALGLLERGHRLISDDVVQVRQKEDGYLIGSGPLLTRHIMEIRGIGLINVAHLFGAVSVRREKSIDLIIQLEKWDDKKFYDRVGVEEKYKNILNISVPFHVMPVKLGRDVILLIETIALNHRLKRMGFNSAKNFNVRLLKAIAKKKKEEDARNHR
ncbi:MAG: HPr(Ser) kinase/phosphatase [Parachlamydiales bacterium]|nr:HPr(Ser) kinase/phosphatase [Parachlamydiales bacterium]